MTTGDPICGVCGIYIVLHRAPCPVVSFDPITAPWKYGPPPEQAKDLTFKEFQRINRKRCEGGFKQNISVGGGGWTTEQWTNALAGEVGELCNMVKKKYSRQGMPLHDDIPTEDLARELADIVTYCDLIASHLGIDLGEFVVKKFNEVSDKLDSDVKIPEKVSPPPKPKPNPANRITFTKGGF